MNVSIFSNNKNCIFFPSSIDNKRSKNKNKTSISLVIQKKKTRINNEFLLFSYSLIYLVVGNC